MLKNQLFEEKGQTSNVLILKIWEGCQKPFRPCLCYKEIKWNISHSQIMLCGKIRSSWIRERCFTHSRIFFFASYYEWILPFTKHHAHEVLTISKPFRRQGQGVVGRQLHAVPNRWRGKTSRRLLARWIRRGEGTVQFISQHCQRF